MDTPARSPKPWPKAAAGTVHAARNPGAGHAAELATYLVEKGKPIVVLAR